MSEVTIPLRSHDEAILVLGPYDRYAKLLRQDLEVEVTPKRGNIRLVGDDANVREAKSRIEHLLGKSRRGRTLQVSDIETILLGGPANEGQRTSSPTPRSRSNSSRSHAGMEHENPAARFAAATEDATRPRGTLRR
ncbi:MAG: hypothetical protein AAF368_15915 [Planctomycetota bacterium]